MEEEEEEEEKEEANSEIRLMEGSSAQLYIIHALIPLGRAISVMIHSRASRAGPSGWRRSGGGGGGGGGGGAVTVRPGIDSYQHL